MIPLLYLLVTTHLTIICVTVYYHRGQAHRGLKFHPALEHVMRFWLWWSTGMVQAQWVAIHRRHHQKTDVVGDPHSPLIYGIWRVLFSGAFLYHTASKDTAMIKQLSPDTPNDWIEKNLYAKHSQLGVSLMLVLDVVLFGWIGLAIWAVQIVWIPFWAAGVINGLGHWWGYRNAHTKDNSRNLVPWGIVVGGEELHSNHHLNPASAKLSLKPWEFDLGWFYIKLFEKLHLLSIVKR
jgi:stearoyl-CoA desaturase (delta-9 desaturase)